MSEPLVIVFALYPGVTHLDFTGPQQVLSRLPGAKTVMASAKGGEIEADGVTFGALAKLADVERCDVLCVPGGLGTTDAMLDESFMREIRRLGAGARYLTSVCTGSLILGAAGFLKGRRAACHWAWRDLLPIFGAIPDASRVARDGNIFTGGGVTAGIDFALTLAAEIAGPTLAQQLQLSFEYAPAPPFDAGRPDTAPPEVLAAVKAFMDQNDAKRRAAAEAAAARMEPVEAQ
ncbi:MAG TPA: DJ-1/PfpI family protein [Caulobacteraceae bacterium]|nr:DJ-1/PfpI family protein [Caulobacteraceae bacterium]